VPGGAQVRFVAQREGGIARAHQLFGGGRQGCARHERAAAAVERGAAAGAGICVGCIFHLKSMFKSNSYNLSVVFHKEPLENRKNDNSKGVSMDLTTILSHLAAFIGGLGAGVTLRIAYSNRKNSSTRLNKVAQKGNFVLGDMSGGDMQKKDPP
jgi:hypothetical protein